MTTDEDPDPEQTAYCCGLEDGRDRERKRCLRLVRDAVAASQYSRFLGTLRQLLADLETDVETGKQFLPQTE